MSVKIERLESSFVKEISYILMEEVKDEILKSLNHAKSFIRGELSKRVEIRHTPELTFVFDESIEYGNRIEKVIEKIKTEE